ncbi:hypothetical protein EDD38_3316 [Kitasatospora cineracea]|uniref:Uncharacterized protein n=2 Tax=Kitasatospora cineracea TaxID=88074 RepID=A0A3N4RNI7_9ACTN|nr:hypothetical protein EDD38_3316 [Kitasatospora cineracea]
MDAGGAMTVVLSLAAIAGLALTAWLEWRAHRRVRPGEARTITPDAIRYVSTPREDRP